jgi:alpha-1,6-mannosyl-glycoprotein beta-1,2-N-acetylglucosaminyltransferase
VIHNEATFGPVDNSTIVVVVQVHSRAEYLKHLIVSFAASRDIKDALVIFSHDLYDAEINELISRIDFCRYAQIYFPLSIQTHPDSFPGDDPRDCPPDMKRAA